MKSGKPVSMTIQERAEKIYLAVGNKEADSKEWDVSFIAAEIQDAVNEAIVERFEGEDCAVARIEQAAYAKGANEGYKSGVEDARKFVMYWKKNQQDDSDGNLKR